MDKTEKSPEFVKSEAGTRTGHTEPVPPEFVPAGGEPQASPEGIEDDILDQVASGAARGRPRRAGLRFFVWLAGVALFFLIAVRSISAAFAQYVDIVAGTHPYVGYLYLGSLAVLVILIVSVVVRLVSDYLRIAKNSELRRMSETVAESHDPRLAMAFAQRVAGKYGKHPDTAVTDGVTALRQRLQVTVAADDILDTIGKEILGPIDEDARELIRREAVRTAISTTISPVALVDMLLVGWRCTIMQRDIAGLYGYRPGLAGSFRLWGWSLANMAYAGASQLIVDYLGSTVVSGLLGKVATQAAQGMTTGVITIRVGIATLENCRPLTLTREEKRGVVALAFEGIKKPLLEQFRFRGATGEDKEKRTDLASADG